MTDELKPCPFCGQSARFLESILNRGGVSCSNHECISWIRTTPETWNTRPVEDALRARIAELEARLRPIPFSERKPPMVGRYLYWHKQYRRWYEEMWPFDETKFTHWLPIPPAPEESA